MPYLEKNDKLPYTIMNLIRENILLVLQNNNVKKMSLKFSSNEKDVDMLFHISKHISEEDRIFAIAETDIIINGEKKISDKITPLIISNDMIDSIIKALECNCIYFSELVEGQCLYLTQREEFDDTITYNQFKRFALKRGFKVYKEISSRKVTLTSQQLHKAAGIISDYLSDDTVNCIKVSFDFKHDKDVSYGYTAKYEVAKIGETSNLIITNTCFAPDNVTYCASKYAGRCICDINRNVYAYIKEQLSHTSIDDIVVRVSLEIFYKEERVF